jgi:hypothetical protein
MRMLLPPRTTSLQQQQQQQQQQQKEMADSSDARQCMSCTPYSQQVADIKKWHM